MSQEQSVDVDSKVDFQLAQVIKKQI